MRMASLGKSKKLQTSKSMDAETRKLEKASSGQNFISRLASMGSLKSSSRRTKSGNFATTPRTVHDAELAELEMAFRVFDANGDGQISVA
jgi:hypothetical protein